MVIHLPFSLRKKVEDMPPPKQESKPRKKTKETGNQGSTVREAQGVGTHCKGGAGSGDPWREMERKPLSGILKVTGLEHPPKCTLHICWEGGGWEENV